MLTLCRATSLSLTKWTLLITRQRFDHALRLVLHHTPSDPRHHSQRPPCSISASRSRVCEIALLLNYVILMALQRGAILEPAARCLKPRLSCSACCSERFIIPIFVFSLNYIARLGCVLSALSYDPRIKSGCRSLLGETFRAAK